ncbi:hypothetical protein C8Q80DRAFT_1274588 [Daedaleopsis nitida]|nr:hypothetical protein C8Q80DRAFT_1274588 [Daedaleopsis nitida]
MPYTEAEAALTRVYLLDGDLVWQTDTAIHVFFKEAALCLVPALVLAFRRVFAVTSCRLHLYVIEKTFLASPKSVDVEAVEACLRVTYFELDWYQKIEPFRHPRVTDYSREICLFLEFLGVHAGEGRGQTTLVATSSSPTQADNGFADGLASWLGGPSPLRIHPTPAHLPEVEEPKPPLTQPRCISSIKPPLKLHVLNSDGEEQAEELVEAVTTCEVPSREKGKDHVTPKKTVKKEPAPTVSSGSDESDSSDNGEGEIVPEDKEEDEEVASAGDSTVPVRRKPTTRMSAPRKCARAQDEEEEEEEEEEDELNAEEDPAPPRKCSKGSRSGDKSRDSKLSMQDLIRIAKDCDQCWARTWATISCAWDHLSNQGTIKGKWLGNPCPCGNQIRAVYNSVGFSLCDPRQLSLEDRLRVVQYIKAFEHNPHQFLKVNQAGLQCRMHPDRIRSRTPRYFFTEEGPTWIPSYDASGYLTAPYGDAPAEVAGSPKKPSSTRKPVSSMKLLSSRPSSSVVTPNCADVVPQVRAIHDEYNESSREIVGLLERLRTLAQRKHRLTQLESGTGIVDVPPVLSFFKIVWEGGLSEHFLTFLVNE